MPTLGPTPLRQLCQSAARHAADDILHLTRLIKWIRTHKSSVFN